MRPVDGEAVPAKLLDQQMSALVDSSKNSLVLNEVSSDQTEAPPPVELNLVAGSLGVLEKFVGRFEGNGFNTIFRPYNDVSQNHDVEAMLELIVTSETLAFMDANILGSIPNRGFRDQMSVMLKRVPYTQMVGDLINEQTGKADRKKPISIHFEQGLFLRTPETKNPKVPATIARLASIPHGTTINAQGVEPNPPVKGRPSIPPVSIVPPEAPKLFENPLLRVPNDIKKFRDSGAIPQSIEKNPNQVLIDNNAKRTIQSHYTFTVSTIGTENLPGGGTSNIAFLMGQKPKDLITSETKEDQVGNAVVANMTCTYWVSTIISDVVIQAGDYDKKPVDLILTPEEAKTGLAVPSFKVGLDKKVSADTKIQLPWTQIQYSQNVRLDFSALKWPHISVATLVPTKDQPLVVESKSPLLSTLK